MSYRTVCKKNLKIAIIVSCIIIGAIFSRISVNSENQLDISTISPDNSPQVNWVGHEPIFLNGSELNWYMDSNIEGSGTFSNPYRLSDTIQYVDGSNANYGIYLYNITDYFEIELEIVEQIGNESCIAAIKLEECANITIKNTEILGNSSNGIYDFNSDNITIFRNEISGFEKGIALTWTNEYVISENIITNSKYDGIRTMGGWYGKIIHNLVSENNGEGIDMSSGNFYYLYNNTVYNNEGDGLDIGDNHGYIYGNNISANKGDGMDFSFSDFLLIVSNTISNNHQYGISLSGSFDHNEDVRIWNNYISGNLAGQAQDTANTPAKWDNGTYGNIWGDYEIQYPDATLENGIWDTSYEISGQSGVFDNYPIEELRNVNLTLIPPSSSITYMSSDDGLFLIYWESSIEYDYYNIYVNGSLINNSTEKQYNLTLLDGGAYEIRFTGVINGIESLKSHMIPIEVFDDDYTLPETTDTSTTSTESSTEATTTEPKNRISGFPLMILCLSVFNTIIIMQLYSKSKKEVI